ncbi:Histidine kinase-, DNA gyrase B-, and HSP90-like ATPase [Streptomyces melanosporofaciens]|uniref:histidine kinase n=1 Tax=Streptomyces melanosporofaciens TaxID=67327 RepID=A0A1H5BCI0_STRMJ|nr:Histidine kinase-, DNA gyrase B-, and HSP90-like ATPase [Streptomyces melanosporofaciens]
MLHAVWATALPASALALAFGSYLRRRRPGPTDTETATATATARLTERVAELAENRAGAIAAHDAELRRIERELHDGTQARLVSLSLRIGLAKRAYDRDPTAARRMLDDAQDLAEEALTELRQVVRGMHPPVLTDRGLAGAVRALAASSGLDVTVRVDGLEDGRRASAAVEAAAYFVVAEALANVARHSGADRAEARLARTPSGLWVSVRDEGRGGAEAVAGVSGVGETGGSGSSEGGSGHGFQGGSGLLGIGRRVAALDGTVTVTSPRGGPTVVTELPCRWQSPGAHVAAATTTGRTPRSGRATGSGR